jgi:hypothetical protein
VALNWKSVSAEHVREAMKIVGAAKTTNRSSGLVLIDGSRTYSAKEVLRLAYRIANKLPSGSVVKFSSGDGTLNVLTKLGFDAKRLTEESGAKDASSLRAIEIK